MQKPDKHRGGSVPIPVTLVAMLLGGGLDTVAVSRVYREGTNGE